MQSSRPVRTTTKSSFVSKILMGILQRTACTNVLRQSCWIKVWSLTLLLKNNFFYRPHCLAAKSKVLFFSSEICCISQTDVLAFSIRMYKYSEIIFMLILALKELVPDLALSDFDQTADMM